MKRNWKLAGLVTGDRKLIGSRQAAMIAGCSQGRIRQLIHDDLIWSSIIGNVRVVDEDEIRAWALDNSKRRAEGKCPGPAPKGFRPDNPGRSR